MRWQDRPRGALHVLRADVEAALDHGARLGAEHEVLARARAGAPAQVLLDELGRLGLVGARGAHQPRRELEHLVGHGHAAHEALQAQDLARRHDRLDLGRVLLAVRRRISSSSFSSGSPPRR
jgi:hypothetical protein